MKRIVFGIIFVLSLFLALPCNSQFTQGEPIRWQVNGHYYNAIGFPFNGGITWNDAKTFAENSTYLGMKGHLATITSLEENSFIMSTFEYNRDPDSPWYCSGFFLGGFQPEGSYEPYGNWQWVTKEPWCFSNWEDGEPNNRCDYMDQPGPTNSANVLLSNNVGPNRRGWNDVVSDILGLKISMCLLVEYEPSIPEFTDVPSNHWAYNYIMDIYYSGITAGCSANPPMYCPDNFVTRAEMAVFLSRILEFQQCK